MIENKKERIQRPGTRRLVQLYAALLYNANLKGFIDGHIYTGNLKAVCVPGFNCYSCPGAIASCPLGSLQNALNAAGTRRPGTFWAFWPCSASSWAGPSAAGYARWA